MSPIASFAAVFWVPHLVAGILVQRSWQQERHGIQIRSSDQGGLLNFATSTSKGFHGSWMQKQKGFSWGEDKDYLLTWAVPAHSNRLLTLLRGRRVVANVNVTASEAARASGPLTLLYALSSCSQHGSLSSFMKQAMETRHVQLHVVGVNRSLEPRMQWAEFLMGPLSAESQRLVRIFKLPETPFRGMKVSILFNGVDWKDVNTDTWNDLKQHGTFPDGYTERIIPGPYHSTVTEKPDLVLAINPGFAHYPATWWPTLTKLRSQHVPIIATGYSNSFFEGSSNVRVVYEYDRRVRPLVRGRNMYLPPGSSVRANRIQEDPVIESQAQGQCKQAMSAAKPDLLCSDLSGNAFVAGGAGYGVRLETRQPFSYCDSPEGLQCQSSAVVSVFEPRDGEHVHEADTPPPKFLREGLLKMLHCSYGVRHHTVNCMTVLIKDQSDAQLQALLGNSTVPNFLNAVLKECAV